MPTDAPTDVRVIGPAAGLRANGSRPSYVGAEHGRVDLVVLFGPPAVGKMTVGRELCARTGLRLFHNHLTIEPLLEVFAYGTPPFNRLLDEFRWRILEEAVGSGIPGLVLTFVWDLESASDVAVVQRYVDVVTDAGGRVRFVELVAPLAVRAGRNNTELRLDHKRSKRDRAFNDANLLDLERHVLSTTPDERTAAHEVLDRHPWLRVDNSDLSAADAAAVIADWLAGLG